MTTSIGLSCETVKGVSNEGVTKFSFPYPNCVEEFILSQNVHSVIVALV